MYKILIIEDDEIIANQLKIALEKWDYEVTLITDFHDILPQFAACTPQLVLLDITLPFYNGFYWCTQIRQLSNVPIIFISSAEDKMNMVMAMNMGADDFVSKPFDMDVLSAKILALLRRTYSFAVTTNLIEYKGAILNLADTTMTAGGIHIDLTKNEFRILQKLFENRGQIVSREELMKHLWNSECFVDDNTLSVNMTRIRKKLAEAGYEDFIVTKKGEGYLV